MARHKKPTNTTPRSPEEEARIAHGPEPLPNVSRRVEAEVNRLSDQIRRYVRRDLVEMREAVERLWIEGAGARQIRRILAERWPNLSISTVNKRLAEVRRLRETEARTNRVEMREQAIERLQMVRQRALTGPKPNFKAAIECEREIAKLAGLYAPTKVQVDANVNHTQAMIAVISNMDPEQAEELLEDARRTERLANAARTLLPSVIDVEPEPAKR